MKPLRMPRNLDDELVILFWSADELVPAAVIFIVGVLIAQKLICLAVALIITRLFRRLKEGRPDGFLLHLGYWYGVIGGGRGYSMPNAFIGEFVS